MDSLARGSVEPSCDQAICDTFSVGLTLIDAALIQDSSGLYNIRSPCFRKEKFKDMMLRWKVCGYSVFLIHTVENMLELNPMDRPTPGEINAILLPYRNEILTLKPFKADK